MALKQVIVNDTGVPVQYWKITGINLNTMLGFTDITVCGYLTQETRDGNMNPVETKKYRAVNQNFAKAFSVSRMNESNNIIEMCYDYLKTFDEFKTAKSI